MNCDFCGEPLDGGRHPRSESGSYDVTSCQAMFLLRKVGDLELKLSGTAEEYAKIVKDLGSKLGSATEQNRSLRAWIRELRDTQEERGQVPADPLYSMLMERIDPLVKADPAPDSADGIRLVALAELCEAYEKRVVALRAPGIVQFRERLVRAFDVGGVMLLVMELQDLTREMRLQGVVSVGKRR